jgi:hypothetical protein
METSHHKCSIPGWKSSGNQILWSLPTKMWGFTGLVPTWRKIAVGVFSTLEHLGWEMMRLIGCTRWHQISRWKAGQRRMTDQPGFPTSRVPACPEQDKQTQKNLKYINVNIYIIMHIYIYNYISIWLIIYIYLLANNGWPSKPIVSYMFLLCDQFPRHSHIRWVHHLAWENAGSATERSGVEALLLRIGAVWEVWPEV